MAGLERTDNGMKQTSWPEVGMINQKNYYTFVNYKSPPLPSDLVHFLLSPSYSPLVSHLLTLNYLTGNI
jgi:hypothetical protein